MNFIQPVQLSIVDIIIDQSFRFVSGHYVLKNLLKTKNWGSSFGLGGFAGGDYRWSANSNGIKYSVGNNKDEHQITVAQLLSRANKWINNCSSGEQLKLF